MAGYSQRGRPSPPNPLSRCRRRGGVAAFRKIPAMSDEALRRDIQSALRRFAEPHMAQPARGLLAALGYRSTKFLRGDPHTVAAFRENFQLQSLDKGRALL